MLLILQVDEERALYKRMRDQAQVVAGENNLSQLETTPPNSRPVHMHYSFDFAQQVHYPNMAAQPGPLYFLTPRKCGVFGAHCEGVKQQINYLIDEGISAGKGSNAVISYLHHFFATFGLGETSADLHCDNCAGQNKNRWVLFYFAWRIQQGLHSEVTLNFMPPGHTKFAPDQYFGMFKKTYRREHVSCLEDIAKAVTMSTAEAKSNRAQLVGLEDGTVLVPTYDWQAFLAPAYKTLQGIKPIGHFRFTSQDPGACFYRTTLADQEKKFQMAVQHEVERLPPMPQQILPPGLPRARQVYLHDHIREFVAAHKRDLVCPKPL